MPHANRVIAACSLFALSLVSYGHGSQPVKSALRDQLTQQVSEYDDRGSDFRLIVRRLAQKYGLRVGMDLESPLKTDLISVHISDGTVAEVLNAIVAQEPGYKWAEIDDVINIMPQQHSDSILDIRAVHFHVTKANPFKVHAAIVALPEVRSWLQQNHVTESTPFAGDILVGPNGLGLARASLDLHDTTLREILNRIIESPKFGSWIVSRWVEKNQYLSIEIG